MRRGKKTPRRVPKGGRYRECASVVVLRPSNVCSRDGCGTIYHVLLLKKPRKRDAWQLPQGGVEAGETLEVAALRELREEAGISARIVGTSSRAYQYDFPTSYRRFRPDDVCGQRISYVFARATGDPIRVDGVEIDEFAWVAPEDLSRYIKRKEYLGLVESLILEAVEKLRMDNG